MSFFLGALMLQLWYILDHVDGEVARYNGESSLTGVYFDELVHYIVHPLVFFGIGWGLFNATGSVKYILLGILSGLSIVIMGLVVDLKDLLILRKFQQAGEGKFSGENNAQETKNVSVGKSIFSKIYSICT